MSMKKNVFKRSLSALLAVLMVLSCWVWFEPVETAAANLTGDSNYLFAYFTGTSIEGQTIHLAVSQDGLNYTALRNNEPVIVPSKGTGCVRDPYIWYNEQDNYYYILATDLDFTDTGSDYSDNSESFIIWRSKDLVHWYDETMIDVKAMGHLIGDVGNMQAVWAPQVLWDGTSYVVYFSLQCNATSNGSWNPLTIVYLRTTDLLDQSAYYDYGVIHNPGRHVIDADIIKKPGTEQYYMFYKDESASGGIQSIYYMISDNGPTGPYYAPGNANDGRGPQLFSEIGKNLEGCNSFFDDNGNLITFVDEYDYTNSAGQKEAHFHVSSTSDFTNYATLSDSSHNINSLSPRHGSVVKITDEEYNRLLEYSNEISSSSFPETEELNDHLVGRYFTTSDYTYNAANGKNDLILTDGSIVTSTDSSGDYYASFNAAGAQINLADLISGDLNIKDGFSITFSASAPATLGSNARFFDISNNWSQRTDSSECYLHMSPVADSNGLYVGAYNGPVTTQSWTWASQGKNFNDGIMHDYIISFADGNMILYIDGELAMKRDRFNMNAEYGDNFLDDNWYKQIGNSTMRIGKSEWSDPLFTGSIQNLCIYDCSMSYYDVQKMQDVFDEQAGKSAVSRIVVPETVYLTPSTGVSKTGQYYVNNTIHNGSNNVSLDNSATTTNGKLQLYIPGVKDFKFNVKLTNESNGVDITASGLNVEDTLMSALNVAPVNGYFSFDALTINLQNGISAGETAVAEWEFTVIMEDGSQSTHYAYSTLYSPYYVPVGAAERIKTYNSKLYLSSVAWVSGVHEILPNELGGDYWVAATNQSFPNESENDGIGKYYANGNDGNTSNAFRYFVPMLYGIENVSSTGANVYEWFSSSASSNTLSVPSIRYINYEPGKRDAMANEISDVAGITIDTSRYTNLNQIPNLTVGYNITDNDGTSGASYWYVSDFTDIANKYDTANNGTANFYNYTKGMGSGDLAGDNYDTIWFDGTDAKGTILTGSTTSGGTVTGSPEYNSGWNRAIVAGSETYDYMFKAAARNWRDESTDANAYASLYVQLRATNVDKTLLRNLVLKATYLNESDYTTASWNEFKSALQVAADALGDPTNSDIATAKNNLETKMNELQTTVKLDANGGSVNGSSTLSFNVTVGAETTVAYNLSSYIPVRTGYVFKGWATLSTATTGSTTVAAGLMPTFYAIWEKDVLNVTFDNIIDFKAWNKSATNGVVSDVTDTGFAVTTKSGFSESYSYSTFFEIEQGKQYIVQMDIVGDAWDVYFFFCDENGNHVDFSDSLNRFSSNGSGNKSEREGNNVTSVFTVPSNSAIVKGQIRLDANGSDNIVSFNNIRVSECYDVTVSPANKFVEYGAEFGTLPTPTRSGYDFVEWCDSDGNSYTASSIMNATSTLYLHSKWAENSYTIKYDTNGGTGSVPADQTLSFSSDVTLSSTVLTKEGYIHTGWSTDPDATSVMYEFGQTVNKLCGEKNGTITLYAVWENIPVINVTFDNLFDYKAYTINTDSLTINERTDTGFTVTSSGTSNDANTGFSNPIAVEPGKTYIVAAEIDITCVDGDTKGYDMYINTLDSNMAGETSATVDTSNGAGKEGNIYISLTRQKVGASTPYIRFTAGANTKYIRIRFDANTPGNVLKVNNIRVYEDTGVTVSPANKYVTFGDALGTLPTPTKSGYDFVGWYDENGTQYTSEDKMNSASTLYLHSKWTLNDEALASDAYVLDFGMKAVFAPLDNDSILKADGTSYKISGVSIDRKTASSTVQGAYGTFTVNGNNIEYVPTTTMNGTDVAYYHVVAGDEVLVGTLFVFPATVVYYEDNVQDAIDYKDGKASQGNTGKWSETGSSKLSSATQNLSGAVYGYDDVYKDSTDNFSMNSAHIVSVSKYNNPQAKYNGVAKDAGSWPVAEFTFAGTGFDLVSLISKETGAVEVQVLDADGNKVYDWIVDTYYGYKLENGEWVVDANADTSIYQIPVIGNNSLAYGTYTVQVIPTYTTRLDHQGDGAYDFYLDAIRVYNPMGNDIDASTIYLSQAEYVVEHQTIRDILIDAGSFGASNTEGVVYINKGLNGDFEEYKRTGPKNEVYLAKGQSVAFNMEVSGFKPTSVQISAHAVDGTAGMKVVSGSSYSDTFSMTHKTTLYYSVPFTAADYWLDDGNGTYTLKAPIVISNTGDGLLSLCNIKVTTNEMASVEPLMFMMSNDDFDTAVNSAAIASTLSADDGALFVPDDMASGADSDVVATGEDVLVTINTSAEVHALTVNGENATLVSVNEDGSKTWNYTFTTESRGEKTFTLVAYNADGFASEETTVTVDVQSKIEIFFNKLTHFFKMIVEILDNIFGN